MKKCPCGSNKDFSQCCEPIIENKKDAATAEELMRSRYTAFTFANIDYLMKSHHSSTRPVNEKREIKEWSQSVTWVNLSISSTEKGMGNDQTGYVEFKAIFIEDGKLNHIHEKSFFEKEDGKWVYVDGTHI